AEVGIRDFHVTGVQTCALPIFSTFTPLEHFKTLATLVSVSIQTGRTHQIRVHAAYAGYPVAGDEKYGDPDRDAKLKAYGLNRMRSEERRVGKGSKPRQTPYD